MSVTGTRVSVGTSAVAVATADADGSHITIRHAGSAQRAVWIGGSTVAAGTGWRLAAGEERSFDLAGNETIYAIAAAGTTTVEVLGNRG